MAVATHPLWTEYIALAASCASALQIILPWFVTYGATYFNSVAVSSSLGFSGNTACSTGSSCKNHSGKAECCKGIGVTDGSHKNSSSGGGGGDGSSVADSWFASKKWDDFLSLLQAGFREILTMFSIEFWYSNSGDTGNSEMNRSDIEAISSKVIPTLDINSTTSSNAPSALNSPAVSDTESQSSVVLVAAAIDTEGKGRSFRDASIEGVGSTNSAPFLPNILMFLNCALWSHYGYRRHLQFLMLGSSCGTIISGFYLFVHSRATPKRKRQSVLTLAWLLLIFTSIHFIEPEQSGTYYLGVTCMIVYSFMHAAPLLQVPISWNSQSLEELQPIYLISAATMSSLLWTIYSIIIHDSFLLVPNVIGIFAGGVQLFVSTYLWHANKNRQK